MDPTFLPKEGHRHQNPKNPKNQGQTCISCVAVPERGQRYAARFFDPKRNTGCEKEASKLRDAYRERCREESREYDRKRIADWNI